MGSQWNEKSSQQGKTIRQQNKIVRWQSDRIRRLGARLGNRVTNYFEVEG